MVFQAAKRPSPISLNKNRLYRNTSKRIKLQKT